MYRTCLIARAHNDKPHDVVVADSSSSSSDCSSSDYCSTDSSCSSSSSSSKSNHTCNPKCNMSCDKMKAKAEHVICNQKYDKCKDVEVEVEHCYTVKPGKQRVKKQIRYNHVIIADVTHHVKEQVNCVHKFHKDVCHKDVCKTVDGNDCKAKCEKKCEKKCDDKSEHSEHKSEHSEHKSEHHSEHSEHSEHKSEHCEPKPECTTETKSDCKFKFYDDSHSSVVRKRPGCKKKKDCRRKKCGKNGRPN